MTSKDFHNRPEHQADRDGYSDMVVSGGFMNVVYRSYFAPAGEPSCFVLGVMSRLEKRGRRRMLGTGRRRPTIRRRP